MPPTRSPGREDPLIKRLRSKQKEREDRLHGPATERERVLRLRQETVRTVELASYAADEHAKDPAFDPERMPIGVRHRRITIPHNVWARRIIAAARAWKAYPGFKVFQRHKFLRSDLASNAAVRLFREAARDGVTVDDIASTLSAIRTELGPASGDFNHAQSELGFWDFFRGLDRFIPTERRRSDPGKVTVQASGRKDDAGGQAGSATHPVAALVHVESSSSATPDRLMRALLTRDDHRLGAEEITEILGPSTSKVPARIKECYRRVVEKFPMAKPYLNLSTGTKRRRTVPCLWLSTQPKPPRRKKTTRARSRKH